MQNNETLSQTCVVSGPRRTRRLKQCWKHLDIKHFWDNLLKEAAYHQKWNSSKVQIEKCVCISKESWLRTHALFHQCLTARHSYKATVFYYLVLYLRVSALFKNISTLDEVEVAVGSVAVGQVNRMDWMYKQGVNGVYLFLLFFNNVCNWANIILVWVIWT